MSQPLSLISLRMRVVVSSIRRRVAVRWWYKVGLAFLSICVLAAAKFDSLSEASGAIRHYALRARTAFVVTAPDTLVVFGPKQFVTVANNSQINFVESFSVPPAAAPDTAWTPAPTQYTIRLQRVGGSLSTATVAINGTQVATAADFSSATYIERSITVNQGNGNTNSLTITLKGSPAAGLTAKIVGVPDASFAIFGPKVYSKGVTTPSHYTDNFTLPAGAYAPYSVAARASVAGTKATITINGVQVIKDADFGTNVTYVVKQSLLAGSNTMQVDVRGTTNTTITVTVLATDKTPPTLTIAAPAPNLVTNAATVTVTGTSESQQTTQVKVNSVVASRNGTQYSATVPLVQGVNTLAVRATDKGGNHTDSTRTVTRDTQGPTLTVTSPADGSYTTQDAVTVAGTVSDPTAVTVKVNGVSYPVGQGGAFSGTYQLAAGANFLTIAATDAPGNVTTRVIKVTQDRTPPTLTVTAPLNGSYTNATAVNVTGTASDAGTVSVKVNGSPVTLTNGSFTYSLTLASGTNAISVIATDGAANATTVSRTIVQDRDKPTWTVVTTPDWLDTYTNATSASFTVNPTDASPLTLTLDAVPMTRDANGMYTATRPLAEGWNEFVLTATDAAGNSLSWGLSFLRDAQPPVIESISLTNGAHFETEPVIVEVIVSDSVKGPSLTVNGVTVEADSLLDDPLQHLFTTPVHLVPGSNTISFVATDLVGNVGPTTTRTVTFGTVDPIPPDPATVAPPLDPTVATTTFAATSFLYTGPNPIQSGVAAGTIQPLRSALIRGMVRARTGDALPGVKVTVLDHPEFGQTLSRADGAFDLVVNGGEPLTVNYQKAGFLPAQRQVSALWQDYAVVESVTLVALDPQVTTVDFSQPAQVAQGGIVTDESGTRQATVIFKGGTQASLKMPDGTTQPINSINVRATEYTVGATGPSAMPGPLPATSSYTYAVEFSADEAIAAGATSVLFDRPVAIYVDNFLRFPVGKPVPVGIYDRVAAQWVPSPDGRIVKVLNVANGRASLDVDGSGSEATPEALIALGVDEPELTKLGGLFAPGKSLWRVQLSHFSPGDLNDPPSPDSSERPDRKDPFRAHDNDCKTQGSVIGCERQTLGESIAIAGTSLRLVYQSDRGPGYQEAYSTDISLIGGTVPLNLQRIALEVRIAGRLFTQTFDPVPNQSVHFVWDGNDVYGRPVHGEQAARIRIGYVYPALYANVMYTNVGRSFGLFGSSPLTTDRARKEATLWQEMELMLGTHDARAAGLGGWSIDVHHNYDPMGRVLFLGDGGRRTGTALSNSTTTIAGADCTANCANAAKPGDRAVDAFIGAEGMSVASDGTMYLGSSTNYKIWRVNAAGILEHVGGNGTEDFSGDGIPATSAGIRPTQGLKVGPDNSVYFTDNAGGGRIRRIDKNGILTTVAGSGVCGTSFAEGTLAREANICFHFFAIAKDGTLYLEDRTEVYRVGTDGILTRIVGDGTYTLCPFGTPNSTCADGKPANAPGVFYALNGIAVGPDGSLYLANRERGTINGNRIFRIGPDGIIRWVAGNGKAGGPLVNGGPAKSASIVSLQVDMGVGADGTLHYAENDGYVYRIDEKGLLRVLAGCAPTPGSASCTPKSGGQALLTTLFVARAMSFGPDGRLYVLDRFARRIDAPVPALDINGSAVASEDGSQLYVFDADGKHLRTLDALLGSPIFDFTYDAAGHLSSISDGQGNVTTVERDGTGLPVTIVAPFGQRTSLTTDGQRYLSSIQSPGQPATVVVHRVDGLLSSLTDPNGNQHQFIYDTNGLLTRDDDGNGGFTTLSRTTTDSSSLVTLTTAMGRTAVHSTTARSIGGSRRAALDSAGLATTVLEDPNGTATTTSSDGTVTTVAQGSDPRFGMQVPIMNRTTIRTPSGLVETITGGRRTVLSNQANPATLVSQVDSLVVNGRLFRNTYIAATKTATAVTPEGRSSTERADSLGRVIEETAPGVASRQYAFDARGRLAQVTHGSRQWSYTYDAQGHLATATDPLTLNSQFFYDLGGRLTRQVLPGGRELLYAYDLNGNRRSVTPPGRQSHQFQHNALNLLTSYTPPSLGPGTWSTTYQYDLDRRLTEIARPDGQTIGFQYDGASRLSTVTVPGGTVTYTYDSGAGRLIGVSGLYSEGLSFSYDGSLLTGATWTGEVSGTLTATRNGDFQITGLSVNGGPSVGFVYDQDGLVKGAGALTIDRSATTGFINGTSLDAVTTSQAYTSYGELASQTARVNGNPVFTLIYGRDTVGRIAAVTETIAGTTTAKSYTYDVSGRLTEVRENGTLTVIYEYDGTGNRLRATRPAGVEVGTYDEQDRLVTYGAASFTYNRNGELETRTVAGGTTHYVYDALGNLRRATLADGTDVDYIVDGLNRRVGKKMNGVLVKAWLYQNQLNPVAEMDGAGSIVSRFVYGTRANVPDYLIRNGTTYRIVADRLGSVRLVTESLTGLVVQQIDYDEWGNVTRNTNPDFQPFGYAGGLLDTSTNLVRLGARDYDPAVGRWTTKDPIGFGGGPLSLYAYVDNNPVTLSDPAGLCPTDQPGKPPTFTECLLNAGAHLTGLVGLGFGIPASQAAKAYQLARDIASVGKYLTNIPSGYSLPIRIGVPFLDASAVAVAEASPAAFVLGGIAAAATGYTLGAAAMCRINTSYYSQ